MLFIEQTLRCFVVVFLSLTMFGGCLEDLGGVLGMSFYNLFVY